MRALLIAAGYGTRLAGVTRDLVPKILVPLAGKPLLAWQLRYLERQGVTAVAINLHHQHEQVLGFLEHFETKLEIRVSVECELLGTAGALVPLADFVRSSFIVLYGDVVTDTNLASLLDRHQRSGALATLAYYESDEVEGKGVLELDDSGRIVGFREKAPAAGAQPINAGIYALDAAVRDFVHPGDDFGLDVWPALTAAGYEIGSYRLDGYLVDVGSPDTHSRVGADLAAGILRW